MENNPDKRINKITGMFADLVRSGVKLYQIYALTTKEMNILYEMAHNLYLEGRYQESADTVKTLCWLNNTNIIYWKALAAVEEKLDNHQSAENAYSMIIMLEPDNHQNYLDMHRYALKLKHLEIARKCLATALELAVAQKKGSRIISQIKSQLEDFKKHSSDNKGK